MTRPWRTLESVPTPEGALELRQRGDGDFLIVIAGRVLMTSAARRSEEALATLALADLQDRAAPRVLVAGLGMGFTLRAALDALPPDARVNAVELNPQVAAWCRGPLAPLTGAAVLDPRVSVELDDVARVIDRAPAATYTAILLDLYQGPHAATDRSDDPVYGAAALERTRAALAPGGVLAVWAEDPDEPFAARLAARFDASTRRVGRGGRRHVIYLARRR